MTMSIDPSDLQKWSNGEPIEKVMPYLSPDEREFITTGILPGELDSLFPDEADSGSES